MKKIRLIISALSTILLLSCSGSEDYEKQLLSLRLDSISRVNEQNVRDLAEVNSIVNIISDELDSIAIMEDMIHFNPLGTEGRKPTKSEMRERLKAFSQMLERQKIRISLLEDSLSALNGYAVSKYRNLITLLNSQLEEKDNTINSLMAELNVRNANIAKLQNDIQELSSENEELVLKTETQQKALEAQDAFINEGYVRIGSKKELQNAGLITGGGFLSKTRVNNSNMDVSLFQKVDIRQVTQLNIPSKSFKILTSIPESSYSIEKVGKEKSVLKILNPTQFWSVSRYLIIQTK